MACITPPELTDKQLLAYCDGEVEVNVTAHLAQCAYCQERLERLEQAQRRLTKQVYRFECPSSTELGEYHLKMLSSAKMKAISAHLSHCPHCSEELKQLQGYLHDLTPEPEFSLSEHVKVLVAKLISKDEEVGDSIQPGLIPAFGLRGETGTPRLYEAGKTQIAIEIQDDTNHPGQKAMLGLITNLETNLTQLELYQEANLIATTEIDDLGMFHIPNLPQGIYDVVLNSSGLKIQIQSLTI